MSQNDIAFAESAAKGLSAEMSSNRMVDEGDGTGAGGGLVVVSYSFPKAL